MPSTQFCLRAALIAVAAAGPAAAQRAPDLRLGKPALLSGPEFSRVVGIRELADGRVLVADALEKQLSVVDFARNSKAIIGRTGDGPGEYRGVSRLLRLPGDSTLLVEQGSRRWQHLEGAGFAGVVTANDPPMRASRTPLSADLHGHFLATAISRDLEGATGTLNTAADSSLILIVTRKTGAVDTIGKMASRPTRITIGRSGTTIQSITVVSNPLAAGEQALLFPDGAVAIAHLNPYRVDWIIDGKRVTGSPLPFESVAVSHDEKVAALARLPSPDGPRDPESVPDWPAVVPAFLNAALFAAPDGRLWIRRTPTLRSPGTDYDVIGRDGRLEQRVHLPAGEAVAGFGTRAAYVIQTDDDGLQYLKRYPLPR